jgi:Mn2+/Fe2+ NRAMP family transporter
MAGAAVGVSHLVQSTRAGAVYGFGLVFVVLLANLAKYPAFRFGPAYAAATGTSLLEGYRRQGRWALGVYLAMTLGTMFSVQAAVMLVTAGLAKAMFGLEASPVTLSGALMVALGALCAAGRFRWLDAVNKVVFATLTLATLFATALTLPKVAWGTVPLWPDFSTWTTADLAFCAALIGWMPSAVDISVWHSLWTLARKRESGHIPTRNAVSADFHVGYMATVVLALCFVVMGAGVMYGSGERFAEGAGGFAAQVIGLFTKSLGDWSAPIIHAAAFGTMFSTALTVVDGFPRSLAVLVARFRGPEAPWTADEGEDGFRRTYWLSMGLVAAGAMALLTLFMGSLAALVDLATTLSFLTAPPLAWLNHRAMLAPEVPADHRPAPWLRALSLLGLALLTAMAAGYLAVRFG